MSRTFNFNTRYIQIAFNHSIHDVVRILPKIPLDPRIIIEAGTPYVKREGQNGIRLIRRYWGGLIVADLKVIDGAQEEVEMAHNAGANDVTAAGTSPKEIDSAGWVLIEGCKWSSCRSLCTLSPFQS